MTTLTQLRAMICRAEATLVYDALGAAALAVMLVVGLHLPTFV